ncbi:MAG: hypothetical protein JWO41_729 [Candidatus Saccharibacteria bacterium]|nr:hypothetical protein [Candidatus Saccharibacteria bacterium]
MVATPAIYPKVIKITHVYLGPAADRFIARQVQNHLGKQPELITREDLASIIDWIGVAVSLLTDDREIIEEYLNGLRKLAKQ